MSFCGNEINKTVAKLAYELKTKANKLYNARANSEEAENANDNFVYKFSGFDLSKDTSGNLTDMYMDEDIAKHYLVRYGVAYAFEYTFDYVEILKRIKNNSPCKKKLKVASIGAGSNIDYRCLLDAMEYVGVKYDVEYHSVDIVRWPCDFAEGKDIHRHYDGATKFFKDNSSKLNSFDIIFFPKSISEFDYITINNIASYLKKVKKPIICFANPVTNSMSKSSKIDSNMKKIINGNVNKVTYHKSLKTETTTSSLIAGSKKHLGEKEGFRVGAETNWALLENVFAYADPRLPKRKPMESTCYFVAEIYAFN